MRLIDADALVKDLELMAKYQPEHKQSTILGVCATIQAKPAIDAEPVRHGRWIENVVEYVRAYPPYSYKNGYKCSLCGRKTRSKKEPYCHCGAKMDLEVQDGT